jgi:hypothetical protein
MLAFVEHVPVIHDGDKEVHHIRHPNVAHGKVCRKIAIRVLEVIVRFPMPLEKLVVVLVLDIQFPIDTATAVVAAALTPASNPVSI